MDLQRAQEIYQAEEKIDVQWNGASVWIDSIDLEQGTARVHMENDPAVVETVPVNSLRETSQ